MSDNQKMWPGRDNRSTFNDILGRIIGATILIGLGVILFLNTTGSLPWSFWGNFWAVAWRFWPLFLIFGGIQIIVGGSRILSFICGLLFLFVLVGITSIAVAYSTNNQNLKERLNDLLPIENYFNVGDPQTKSIIIDEDEYPEAESVKYNIELLSGDFSLRDTTSEKYFSVDSKFYDNFGVPILKHSLEDNTLLVNFQTETNTRNLWNIFSNTQYEFILGKASIPSDITLKLTSGTGDIQLTQNEINAFNLDMTSGNIDIKFNETSLPNDVNVNLTSGNLTITVPDNTGINLNYSKTSGRIEVNGIDLKEKEGVYSLNSSSRTLNLDLTLTSGNVEILFK